MTVPFPKQIGEHIHIKAKKGPLVSCQVPLK